MEETQRELTLEEKADAKSTLTFQKYVDGGWEVVKMKELEEGDIFRPHTPEDTTDDQWYQATSDPYIDPVSKTWTVESVLLNRQLTEEDGGDLPTEEE